MDLYFQASVCWYCPHTALSKVTQKSLLNYYPLLIFCIGSKLPCFKSQKNDAQKHAHKWVIYNSCSHPIPRSWKGTRFHQVIPEYLKMTKIRVLVTVSNNTVCDSNTIPSISRSITLWHGQITSWVGFPSWDGHQFSSVPPGCSVAQFRDGRSCTSRYGAGGVLSGCSSNKSWSEIIDSWNEVVR